MKTSTEYLWFDTSKKREYINITGKVEEIVGHSGIAEGMVLVSAMHITASVYVNDAEDGLIQDIDTWLEELAPFNQHYKHHRTGETNGDAHLKSLLMHHEVIVPVTKGKLDFGPWQQIYYAEFDGQRRKRVVVKVMGSDVETLCCMVGALIMGSRTPAQTVLQWRGDFIDVDYARYFGDEKQVYLEVYYGIHENSITYHSTPTGFSGSVKMRLVVRSESTASAADDEWLVPHEIPDSSRMTSTQILTGLKSVGLPQGSYSLEVLAWDVNNPARKDSLVVQLPISYFPHDAESMSDLELCTMINSSTNKESIFYKNTLEVTPNPARRSQVDRVGRMRPTSCNRLMA
jgi:secondary thiamine-phosphate synthase enzyme